MRTLVFIGALLPALILVGCQNPRTLYGTWESTGNNPVRITFSPDGIVTLRPSGMARNIELTGQYRLVENKIKMENMSVDLPDNNPMKGLADRYLEGGATNMDLTLSWKTDDEIVLDGSGMLRGGFSRVEN